MDSKSEFNNASKPKLSIEQMLKKLDGMYEREDEIQKEMIVLETEWIQLQQDKELLQMMIMHVSNKSKLKEEYNQVLGR